MKEKLGNKEDQLIYYNCSWGGGLGYGLPRARVEALYSGEEMIRPFDKCDIRT